MSMIKEGCECNYCKVAELSIERLTRDLINKLPISEKEKLQLMYDAIPSFRKAHDSLREHYEAVRRVKR